MIKQAWNNLVRFVTEFDYRTLKNMGIGKTLLLWFLAISLVPLATLSFINFLYYYQGLNVMAKKSLFTTSQLRMNYLTTYFDEMNGYLETLSRDGKTVPALEAMQALQQKAHATASKKGDLRNQAGSSIEMLRTALRDNFIPEGVDDIYFVTPQGRVAFTLFSESDLNADLLAGPLATSRFGRMAKAILKDGKPLFSDLERYAPAGNEVCGFLGSPVFGSKGELVGVLALRFNTAMIDRIVQYGIGFGNSGHVYLVGLDLALRSASKINSDSEVLIDSAVNQKTRTWQGVKLNNVNLSSDGKPITEEVSIYKNSEGVVVMGLYRNIDVLEKLGVHWALIEEIDQEEAHVVARELSTFAKISLILTTIIVVLLSIIVTRRFVYPIKRISEWAKQVAHGELVSKDIQVAENEVGEMKDTFNWLVKSLQSFAEVSQSVALGDYSKTVKVRSEKDTMAISMNEMVESFKNVVKQAKSIASGDYSTNIKPRSDQDTLGIALYEMTMKLREAHIEIMGQDWLKTGINELGLTISGDKSITDLSQEVMNFLARYLNAQIGYLFLADDKKRLQLAASYAGSPEMEGKSIGPGEGLIGQVARERKVITFFATDYDGPQVNIGPEVVQPHHFIVSPILYEGQLLGVIEMGSFEAFDEQKQMFLTNSIDNISVAINTARSRERVQELLSQTQEQAKELVMQKEELRQINQELEEQAKALKLSEESLQHQQEELRVINEELEERTKVLELQRDDIRKKNQALEQAQQEIHHKAEALEIASRYKSEFLANMSHELRTPLNSILVLSELLALNKQNNMSAEEIEFAGVINASGKDLLELINDILDLSKVEAGRFEIDIEEMNLEELEDYVKRTFSQMTKSKGISLSASVDAGLPEYIMTDSQRVMQIVKNLMSNAIKFTQKGGVSLRVTRPAPDTKFHHSDLSVDNCIAIRVSDTGIGIDQEKIKVIFEAFQQADGTISRKFGGTGLGLTISRSLSRLLGGEIQLESKVGEGSAFTLYLPLAIEETAGGPAANATLPPKAEVVAPPAPTSHSQPEHRRFTKHEKSEESENNSSSFLPDTVFEGKKILIVDDDMRNVFVLSKILEEKKVNIVIGRNGREGLEKLMANPDTNLVLMDIMMPEIDGYTAMREIRKDGRFTQLPIIALTAKAMKGDREKCIEAGANDYMSKPVQTEKLLTLLRVWLHK